MPVKIADIVFKGLGVPKFEKYLNLSSLKQKLISGNIANVSTPGYKSEDINFEDEYKKLTQKSGRIAGSLTHRSHIPLGNHAQAAPRINQAKIVVGEMNSVDIDKEMASLAQNELRYSISAKLIQMKFNGLQKVITSK